MTINTPNLLGDHSVMDPPDPMPNSVVKRNSADGSVGSPHVRVGHRQASKQKTPVSERCWSFFMLLSQRQRGEDLR